MNIIINKLFLTVTVLFLFSACSSDAPKDTESEMNFVTGYIYLGGNTSAGIRWHTLTHLNIAFLYANDDGSLSDSQIRNSLKEIVDEARQNNVKALVSLRDDAEGRLVNALTYHRSTLVTQLLQYAQNNRLDGIDFDFEDWGREGIIPHLHAFAEEFHQKKPDDLLFTCAVNMYDRGYSTEWHTWFDVINVMTYDVHGPWNNEGQHSPYEESLAAIVFWKTKMKAPGNKLTLGLPFYGYSWNEGDRPGQSYTYEQILAKYPDMDVPNNDRIEHLYYNGKKTIKRKTQWVKDNKIGGVMIWQIGGDAKSEEESLLEAIYGVMSGK